MDANELKVTIARLDEMRARCDAVVKRENCKAAGFAKPLQPDRTVGRKRINAPNNPPINTPVASGPLAGREMRAAPGYRPRKPTFVDTGDGSIDSIFADFEAAFDEMAQAHRA